MGRADYHVTDEQLSLLLDNCLSPEEQARLESHLRTCGRCARAYEGLQQTVHLLHLTPRLTPPRAFTLTEADVARERGAAPIPLWRGLTRWATALTAAALVILLGLDLTGFLLAPGTTSRGMPQMFVPAVREAPAAVPPKEVPQPPPAVSPLLRTKALAVPTPARAREAVQEAEEAAPEVEKVVTEGGITVVTKEVEKAVIVREATPELELVVSPEAGVPQQALRLGVSPLLTVTPTPRPEPATSGQLVAEPVPPPAPEPLAYRGWPWYRWGEVTLALVLVFLLLVSRPWRRTR